MPSSRTASAGAPRTTRPRTRSRRCRGGCSPTRGRGSSLLAGARPRCIPSRLPRFRVVAERKRLPRTLLSASAGSVVVSRNRRGNPSPGVPATSNCRDGGVLRGWDTTASTRRLATPPWPRRAGVWTGCLVGRKHARAPAGRRRGHTWTPLVAKRFLALGITGEIAAHTSGLGVRLEAAGPDGIRWSMPDHSGGLLKSRARARLDRPRSDL